jgi:hypothetical protein
MQRAASHLRCPTGKSRRVRETLSTPARENILLRDSPKSHLRFARPVPLRGVSRSSRTLVRDAMDAMRYETNDAVADGEVVWFWRPDAGAKSVVRPTDDGGKQARSPGRARRKPLKPLRREGRMIRLYLWFCRVLFVARGPWVRAGTRPSLRPLSKGRRFSCKSPDATASRGANARWGMAGLPHDPSHWTQVGAGRTRHP